MVGMPVINFAAIKPMGNPAARDMFSNLAEGANFVDNLRNQKNAQKQAQLLNALREAQLQNLPAEQALAARMGEVDIGSKQADIRQKLAHTDLFRAQAADLPFSGMMKRQKEEATEKSQIVRNYARSYNSMTQPQKDAYMSNPKNAQFHAYMMKSLQQDVMRAQGFQIGPEQQGQQIPGQQPQQNLLQAFQAQTQQAQPQQMQTQQAQQIQAQQQQQNLLQALQAQQAQVAPAQDISNKYSVEEAPDYVEGEYKHTPEGDALKLTDNAVDRSIRNKVTQKSQNQMDAAIDAYHMFKDVDFKTLIKDASSYMGLGGEKRLEYDLRLGKKTALNHEIWLHQLVPNLINQLRKMEGLGVDKETRAELKEIFQLKNPGFIGTHPKLARKYSLDGIKLVKKIEKSYLAKYLADKRSRGVLKRIHKVDYSTEGRRRSAAPRRRKPTAASPKPWSI